MRTEKQQPPQTETDEPTAEPAPKPPAQAETRELAVDDVESDEGDDVKGGAWFFAVPCA
ncbi:MAG: hypothetical protein H6742_09575 [Alphaproteobacteria bacterium]|nr:hypothetical protein [Alphaproteobacteria bacterium]